jgi:hypothetical protein
MRWCLTRRSHLKAALRTGPLAGARSAIRRGRVLQNGLRSHAFHIDATLSPQRLSEFDNSADIGSLAPNPSI